MMAALLIQPACATPDIQAGFSPEGSAQQLIMRTISDAGQEIRLMGYTFTSPDIAHALVDARKRGVDVRVVLDAESNNKYSRAAINTLVLAGIPVRTVSSYKILHDKVIITDRTNVETGSFNFSRAASRVNSENAIVIRNAPDIAKAYLKHWQSRWEQGKAWTLPY
ncbi:phospholipase D family protein [Escherichia coli]